MMIFWRIMSSLAFNKLRKRTTSSAIEKPKKSVNRFNGLTVEEILKNTLPDYLEENLDMVFIGINPGLMSAHRGRYYAGPGNHFYKLLYESGLTPRCMNFDEDHKLLQYGIGLTNIVSRTTSSSADLKKTEIKEGAKIIEEKIKLFKPKIAIFNGKCIYEVYANKTSKSSFHYGLQPEHIENTAVWVVPSSSARCANFPRMTDKLHFYTALKKYLQFLKGEIKEVDLKEFFLERKCNQSIPSTSKMWRRKNISAYVNGGRIANKDTIFLDNSDENVAIVCSTEFIVKKFKQEQDNDDKNDKKEISETCVSSLEENLKSAPINNKLLNGNVEDRLQDSTESKSVNIKSDIKYNRKDIYKRNKRLFPTNLERTFKVNESVDFVKLIKQRLKEKTTDGEETMEKK
ncbi:PREDICTED: G/T mismatch-specific thymine DNA glycosylase-like [Polistes dominula]|uniref:G/T mismatch-specific thymine DNA glycosylase-like n=1 Tax=Polistes dominula TaxID=743375 RepID=A0ABM1JG81_POLDO|nr:PREDICTED: G/T mismatch-specific thymine DNA glycosylase-like [Polistes dominula]